MLRMLVAVVLGCVACGGAAPPPAKTAPRVVPPSSKWQSQLDRDHALVGKVWDVAAKSFIEPAKLWSRLASARFVLLGERHDNPDHHRLQARTMSALLQAGRHPAVALEMLEVQQQASVDAYMASPGASAASFGAALGWEKTSWPPFSEYQSIFAVAFDAKLPVFAANLAQADAKALVKQGASALSPERAQLLALDRAFPAPLEADLQQELSASHCGQLPDEYLAPMALAQHARDAQMAEVLTRAGEKDGAVLIAGGGHARLDRGVPYYLRRLAPNVTVASVLFREVRHGDAQAETYATEEGPFDFVWFTPRHSDEDPCAGFKPPSK